VQLDTVAAAGANEPARLEDARENTLASVVNPRMRIVEHPNAISVRGGYEHVLAAHEHETFDCYEPLPLGG
jgi:hypothetical protein